MREVYRDEDIVAFFPTEPATPGHTLVVPREHIQDIWSLDNATTLRLAEITRLLAIAARKALRPQGLNIIQSNGQAATQTVSHLHVHLVPRWDDDAIPEFWPKSPAIPSRTLDAALGRMRAVVLEGEDT